MNTQRRIVIGTLAAFLFNAILLVGMIARHGDALRTGETLVLDAQPVDPRDPLLGHYLALRFSISVVERKVVEESGLATGDTAYAALAKAGDGNWQVVSLHAAMPRFTPERPVLRARLYGGPDGDYAADYGIERYYLPEQDAEAMGERLAGGGMQLEVSVSPSTGRAAVKRILVNGEPVYEDPLF